MVSTVHQPAATPEEDNINFRELLDVVISGKWLIFSFTSVAFIFSCIYAFLAQPVYVANGLLQVEKEKNGIGASLDQLSSLIGSAPAETGAELAIIKSRMVLGAVVDNLKLHIYAEPHYFPVIGKKVSNSQKDSSKPKPPPLGLSKYAWGGEKIIVTALDFPPNLHNLELTLIAKGGEFDLIDENKNIVLTGKVGTRATVSTPTGQLSIFVQELVARPGTEFKVARLASPSVLDSLSNKINVLEQPRDSGVITIQVEGDDPRFAARLVDEIENAYLKQNVERRSAQAAQSLLFLKEQLPELRDNVDQAQAKLNSYQLKKGSVDVQQETQLILQQAVDFETKRVQLVQERNAALQRFTAQHPVVTTLNEQIRGLEREQANVKRQAESLPETQQEILSLMRDLEVNTQLYTALLNSAQELQVTKAGTVGNVRIIDHGMASLKPVKPNKKTLVLLGTFLGAFFGVVTVFALRATLRGIDKPEDVERITGIPTYASIPYSRAQHNIMAKLRRSESGKSSVVLASADSKDLAIEAMRSLRTSLHFAMLEASNNIVMFTGPVAALGKSFVTINLGSVLAMSGKRVLVIDADMRRGQLHRYIGANQAPGLSDYVAGTADKASIVTLTATGGLDFISTGTRPPNPAELLMNDRFSSLLQELSKTYDYILLDTPPVLPVTDAAIIGRLAGTTLVVLKSAEHPMRAIQETVKRLTQAGITVRGMIFNQVGAKVGSYGYGSYGYSYGYSSYSYQDTKNSAQFNKES